MKVLHKIFVDLDAQSIIWKDIVDKFVTGLADMVGNIVCEL